jgi:hypothetical protein
LGDEQLGGALADGQAPGQVVGLVVVVDEHGQAVLVSSKAVESQ